MTTNLQPPKVSIAPMMDWTDRHYRFFMRTLTKKTLLYTEMITTGAILYGDRDRFLSYSKVELPLAIQLGGDNPDHLAECSIIAEGYGYTDHKKRGSAPSASRKSFRRSPAGFLSMRPTTSLALAPPAT